MTAIFYTLSFPASSWESQIICFPFLQAVRNETGQCKETMTRKEWNVKEFIGQSAQLRLVDSSSDGWAHINFDDLKGEISCSVWETGNSALIVVYWLPLIDPQLWLLDTWD